ncbi:MAG: ATP-binding protein, partial [Anaerolineales bacterium]
ARYALVITLNSAFGGAILVLDSVWAPLLSIPLVVVNSMLVTHSGLLTGAGVMGLTVVMTVNDARDYPLDILALTLLLTGLVTWRTVETLFTALTWYSSMQQRADDLLEQTRAHRADLMRANRSLEIAHKSLQRLQGQLVRARKNAEEARKLKERFAANISHELRTPLNLILGFTDVIYTTPEVYGDVRFPPKLRRDIYQIRRSSRHLLEMIDDILDLSHIEMNNFAIRLETTDTHQFLAETLDIAQSLFRGNVPLRHDIAPDLPMLDIDRTRVRQALLNLLNNARRFTEQGHVTLKVFANGPEIVFQVLDTGAGIPADKLAHIFDEFYQVDYSLSRSHGGTGLGLAITKSFVNAHHGRIWAESIAGEGSTFSFTLPITETPRVAPPARAKSSEAGQAAPYTVLVVDADTQASTMLRRALSRHEIVHVPSLAELPAAIAQHHPNAVIHNVPPNASAPIAPDLPIPVIQCSLPSKQWMIDTLDVFGYLAKPITADSLLGHLCRIPNARRVLVMDDDRGFVQLIERILESQGNTYSSLHAYDGESGLALAKAHQPDVILLDLAMPHLDGFAFLEHLRQADLPSQPAIILLTATTYLDDKTQIGQQITLHQRAGLNPAEVLNCLRAMLDHTKPRYPVDYDYA